MKTTTAFLAAFLLTLLVSTPVVYAKDHTEIISNKIISYNRTSQSVKDQRTNVKINDNEFNIDGTVSSIDQNQQSFTINNQVIYRDYSQITNYWQKGIILVGRRVKVEGTIVNSKWYAENVNVIGTGQGNFQIKLDSKEIDQNESEDENTTTPVPTASPTPSTSPSPSASPTPAPSASPSSSPEASTTPTPAGSLSSIGSLGSLSGLTGVNLHISGTVNQISDFFNQIFSFFKNWKI